ncbi:hypothetical protein JDV02_001874 [Purpureocillium takamizusanense]|uniref:Uncharacterized protein n=1 Tax=Purpureocillium takamizusanense TaxID=2060973 RepID=A0A9Q8V7Z4_9HYPO|nr:uncharacterized protein JDV02_001874 [Purpureocillium takamizusanense]UNI15334.1 hypothetical protein JDV02_001874 [Purpureocillium takamizusanense]
MKTSFVLLLSAVATVMALDSAPKQALPRDLFSPATEAEKRDFGLGPRGVCCCLCDPCNKPGCRTCLC